MTGLGREQLEAFRRQVEEDYRLDIAAIERLQRRFVGQDTKISAASFLSGNNGPVNETHGSALPALEPLTPPQPDELTGTLRTMFSTLR